MAFFCGAVHVNGGGRNQSNGGPPAEAEMPDECLEIPQSSRYLLDKSFLMDVHTWESRTSNKLANRSRRQYPGLLTTRTND